MKRIWERIEAWLKINDPEILNCLEPGATQAEIENTAAILGGKFPEDFKASYRIHNGLEKRNYSWIDSWKFLGLERIIEEWKVWKELFDAGEFDDPECFSSYCELDRVIKINYWWNPKWIPITYDGAGNHGQIITLWHDCDDRELVAVNFRSWLEKIAEELENGVYIYNEKYNYLEEA